MRERLREAHHQQRKRGEDDQRDGEILRNFKPTLHLFQFSPF